MRSFTVFEAVAAPLDLANVDTDRIIPARFLRKPRTAAGLGPFAFHDIRFDESGGERADFVLNQEPFRDARILIADENFGCGSSRESAVWALADYHGAFEDGFRAIIAPSFGDIFYNNCSKNGILPVRLPDAVCRQARDLLRRVEAPLVRIDLPAQRVTLPDASEHSFEIDPFRKECLLEGLDDIALTLKEAEAIAAYEARLAGKSWRG